MFPNKARFHPLTSNSVSFWLKTTQNSRFDLIVQRTGSNDPDKDNYTIIYNHNLYGNEWSYPHYTGLNTVIRNIPLPDFIDDEWHHFVYVKDTEHAKMLVYFDGDFVISKPINDFDFSIHGTLTIGKWVSYYFTGSFDDFRVYNRALRPQEVLALYEECGGACLEIDLGADTSYCQAFSQTLVAGDQYPHYLWSTGDTSQNITVSTPGVYWVKGYFENGCGDVDSINIELFSDTAIDFGPDITLCYGASKVLKCGDCFQSYLWSTGDTVSSILVDEPGYYWVEAVNAVNDTISDAINISVLPEIEFSLGEDRYMCPEDFPVEIKAEEGFSDYLWNTGQKEEAITVGEGKYWVEVRDENGCTASDTIMVLKNFGNITYRLYPNPAGNYLTVEINTFCVPQKPVLVEVIDMNQQVVMRQEMTNDGLGQILLPYDMAEAPYMVRIISGDQVFVRKIIVIRTPH